jgi:uncharacterized protein
MQFDWDENKRTDNIGKHGIDFVDASKIFFGRTIEWIDDREGYGEERLVALGRIGLLVLRVVYTLRDDGDTVRIISAQRASKHDEQRWYEEIQHG